MSVLQGFKSIFLGEDEIEQEEEYQSIYENKKDYGETEKAPNREVKIAATTTLQIVLARPNDFS